MTALADVEHPLVGVVVPTWNAPDGAARCLAAVAALRYPRRRTFVVDNGSGARARAALHAEAARSATIVVDLPENRGFAGAVNVGIETARAAGCDAVLVLNDDAEVAPDLLDGLLAAAAADAAAGVVAPRIVDAVSGRESSRGERLSLPLLCVPRTWLRVRGDRQTPYRVSGVLGVAFLLTRACIERVGLLAEPFFAYYEEVDYWLRVREAGLAIVVVPRATVRHRGFRGFAGGFTPLAAYLKARNLPLVVRRNGGILDWIAFVPAYVALLVASAAGYALRRGGGAVVAALVRGVCDAWRAPAGPPPAALARRAAVG